MTFEDYARIVDSTLEKHWGIAEAQVNTTELSRVYGVIKGTIILLDGSYMDFSEEIFIVENAITKKRYRYQYVKNNESIFRYDNYPNHPGLRPPYHHKHVAAKRRVVRMKEAPKLIDVLEEALRYMF